MLSLVDSGSDRFEAAKEIGGGIVAGGEFKQLSLVKLSLWWQRLPQLLWDLCGS